MKTDPGVSQVHLNATTHEVSWEATSSLWLQLKVITESPFH